MSKSKPRGSTGRPPGAAKTGGGLDTPYNFKWNAEQKAQAEEVAQFYGLDLSNWVRLVLGRAVREGRDEIRREELRREELRHSGDDGK